MVWSDQEQLPIVNLNSFGVEVHLEKQHIT